MPNVNDPPVVINREKIKALAQECGFTLRDGDLRPYVYEFAERLTAPQAALVGMLEKCAYMLGDVPRNLGLGEFGGPRYEVGEVVDEINCILAEVRRD